MAEGEEQDDAQKTEEPTAKRLADARKKGQVALSRELNNWVMLLAATLLISFSAFPTLGHLREVLTYYIANSYAIPSVPGGLNHALNDGFKQVLLAVSFPMLVLFVAAFVGPFLQVGPLFAPETIKPDMGKISPIKGFSRLFSMRSVMEFLKGLLKIVVIGTVCTVIIMPFFGQFEHFIGLPIHTSMEELLMLVKRMMIGVLVVLLVIAVIDVIYQRVEFNKKMRMSRQEIKDEYKQTEGDPHIRAKLRQLRMEKSRQRMMQAVPSADVVITNPTHYAIALKYDPEEMEAPLCVAKGHDDLALRIREVAKENDVMIYEAPPLARALYDSVEVDQTIPPQHFKAVAEVISYVFKLRGKLH